MRITAVIALALVAGCASITDSNKSTGSTDYTVSVSVTGSKTHVDRVQVCVKSQGDEIGCGPQGNPSGIAVGGSAEIAVKADPGWSYTVEVPANQQASAYCSVTGGGSGVFGTSMPAAVVQCN